jgi:hypothetical protein
MRVWAEAPISAPAPLLRPAQTAAAAPANTLLPADLVAAPTAKPAGAPADDGVASGPAPAAKPDAGAAGTAAANLPPAPAAKPTPPQPKSPVDKPAPPETAETLDWAREVRAALETEVSIAPPTPLSPNPPPDLSNARRFAPAAAPLPRIRPERRKQTAWAGAAALVCKDTRLAGEAVAPIADPGACGIPKPVRLTHVAGVALSSPIYVTCAAGSALAEWLAATAASAPDLVGAEVATIAPFASYACRNRNGRAGGKLSEHAKGRAVDVGRFGLSDGRSITVKEGWRDPKTSGFLKRAWRTACKSFGTVLGPGADIHHQDHFHLDVAKHRNGPYCR